MSAEISLFNTLGRREEIFVPLDPGRVRLYTCGPTVHNYAHIGNLRTYIFEDTLRRMFAYFGYHVRHVMNVTDVGHLTSDADTGEDKMALGARREGKSVWEIARHYEKVFFEHLQALNILRPEVVCRATEHIPEMIAQIQRILENGFGYQAGGNVYFAVDRFPQYSQLASLPLEQLQAGARVEVDPHKRNLLDFVLWFTRSKFSDHEMKWDSPWGIGYPGWHIECSAMALKYLGERLDIHCGGVDHIPIHHTNEMAQSETALGHRWVNYWLHSEFLLLKSSRMSKSTGGFITLADVEKRGFSPLDFRYFCLGAHYRSKLQFDWQALEGAHNARQSLRQRYLDWLDEPSDHGDGQMEVYRQAFASAIRSDLDLPQALAITWKLAKDPSLGAFQKRALLLEFDRVFALGVEHWSRQALPVDLQRLVDLREQARRRGDYATADALRQQLLDSGVAIKDTPDGPRWHFTHPHSAP